MRKRISINKKTHYSYFKHIDLVKVRDIGQLTIPKLKIKFMTDEETMRYLISTKQ